MNNKDQSKTIAEKLHNFYEDLEPEFIMPLIPAAGRGIRLRPITHQTPKCLIQVDRKSLLEYALENLCELGFRQAVVVVGHMANEVEKALQDISMQIEIKIARQDVLDGLPGAIFSAKEFVEAKNDLLIYCPDNYFTDFRDILRTVALHKIYQPDVVISAEHTELRKHRPILELKEKLSHGFSIKSVRVGQIGQKEITSTGLCTLKSKWIAQIPNLPLRDEEYRLFDLWSTILENQGEILGSLITGERYDISTPDDVQVLDTRLRERRRGVSIILENPEGQLLLMLRDDKPFIRYPGYWALFGGTVEPDEMPQQAIIREIREELGIEVCNPSLIRKFRENHKDEYLFHSFISYSLDEMKLKEGAGMRYFSPSALINIKIRDDDKESIRFYLSRKGEEF